MITLLLLIILYITGQYVIRLLFLATSRAFPMPFPYWIVALVFFPGTFVHETAHLLTAVVLLLRVRGFHLLPEWKANHLTLGHVTYEKADFIRGFFVGIAPIPVGLAVLWGIFTWYFSASAVWWVTIITAYLTFAISSTMFTSKSDLTDAAAFLLMVGILYGAFWLAGIELIGLIGGWFTTPELQSLSTAVFSTLNIFLTITLVVHLVLIVLFRLIFRV